MTKEELEREYYGRRPTEPYSEDDSPNDWANIVQYAEENLNKAFNVIAELEKEKCELLGLVQAKDKLIEKMKSCGNCKWCSNQCCIENFENPISHRGCENYSQWELAE